MGLNYKKNVIKKTGRKKMPLVIYIAIRKQLKESSLAFIGALK